MSSGVRKIIIHRSKRPGTENKFVLCVFCRNNHSMRPMMPDETKHMVCEAAPLPKMRDPVDGEFKPYSIREGRLKFAQYPFDLCSNRNDGNCKNFRPS